MMKKHKKIFVVDDDMAINEAIRFILEDAGYEVMSTVDSNKVLQMVKERPDLILLDIWMPGIDGRVICQALKSENLTKHISVIMVSAARETETIAKECGADDYILKPFEMDDLLSKIAKYVG